ncbi:protein O-GlcNAcase-like isoform X6 [Numida meleagris]|uniref:protein O-GlcNAcase-like isoform X6 n=1 Tax=Numida meleagris TaxID=8996 RepID=UPI000B3DC9DC|nr:protein O-GlcNAcase-like isoform X6 [Numida meleagris]
MAGRPRFLCGVVEGFYGRPWSMEQRKLLFRWLKRWGLNCYMYAPKDELKHRLLWREPYTEHEAAQMQSLIKAAQEHDVEFIFAISAGQDIVFSSAGDRLLLQQKLRQVAAMGCSAFALLFDDIDPCMCRADRDVFPSLAQAQASVANEAYRELGLPPTFLFCPTEYCSSLCFPSPAKSCYLQTLGRELLPEIKVIWTGPRVVSQELSVALVEEVEHVLQRRLLIWDNLFANDYDCRRVFLGPYTGRAPGLLPQLCGLLLNPNCELQANFIPIHTLGSWFRCELWGCAHTDSTGTGAPAELEDGQGLQEGYSPQKALELALLDWVAEIKQQVLEAGGRTLLHPSTGCEEEAGQHPGTAGGQEALPGPQPRDAAPSGADQHEAEPCDMMPGSRKRKAISVPEEGNGSETSTGGPQSPAGDRDQLASGSRASCEPSSALPITAGSDRAAGTPVADETLHSLGAPTCCSGGASTSQNTPPDTSDARGGGSNPPGSPQPGASTADVLQVPSGSRAGPSPAPISQLIDGATASPGPTALLTNGTALSPAPTVPLISEEARPGPTAPLRLEEARSNSSAPLTMEEARMLVELFYLPYHHGPQAQHLLEDLQWLRANSPSTGVPAGSPTSCVVAQWRSRARSFQQLCAQTCCLHSRFVRSAGQALLYDLHPYLWDIRNLLLAASAFVLWLEMATSCVTLTTRAPGEAALAGRTLSPGCAVGASLESCRRCCPWGTAVTSFATHLHSSHPGSCTTYARCYPGTRVLGSFLSLSPEYTFVLEDEGGPCGYAAGALCAEGFLRERDSSWLPAMQRKYPRELGVLGQGVLEEALLFFHTKPAAVPLPVLRRFPSLVQLDTAPRVQDVGARRSLAVSLLSALRANGSRGVFCQVSAADHQQLSFYSKLGFVALPMPWPSSPDTRLLGRLL